MDEVEFLFQCVRDKKISKEQGDLILKKPSSSVSLQKAAIRFHQVSLRNLTISLAQVRTRFDTVLT